MRRVGGLLAESTARIDSAKLNMQTLEMGPLLKILRFCLLFPLRVFDGIKQQRSDVKITEMYELKNIAPKIC